MTVKHELLQEGLGLVNAMRYAASPTAYTSATLAAAVAAVGSTAATIYLEPATWTITSTVTLPATCGLALGAGTVLDLSGGVVLTLGGGFTVADTQRQLFSGTGTVVLPAALPSPIVPQWWGAMADGISNDTVAVQAALTAAAASGIAVVFPKGIYLVDALSVPNGVPELNGCSATLRAISGASGQGMLSLAGTFFSTTPVTDCWIHGLTLDANGQNVKRAVFLGGANTRVTVENNSILNFVLADAPEGIRLYKDVTACRILGNTIAMLAGAGGADTALGIYIVGIIPDSYGGYFANSGTSVFPANIPHDNFIAENTITDGTHGIALSSTVRNTIVQNLCRGNVHRGIILSPQVDDCVIANNTILDCGSSGIHVAYLSRNNVITGNKILSAVANGEGGIQCYVGSGGNLIANNLISCTSRYGVYSGSNGAGNRIMNNTVDNYALCGIAVEADWLADGTVPVGATYSRPNNFVPPAGQWTYFNQSADFIEGNTILDPDTGATACGIYLAAVGTGFFLNRPCVLHNFVYSPLLTMQFMIYDAATDVVNLKLVGNCFGDTSLTVFDLGRGWDCMGHRAANEVIDTAYVSWSDGDTTPSVEIGGVFATGNLSPTSITYFNGGKEGYGITVRIDNMTTIVHNNSFIRLKGNANIVGASANQWLTFHLKSSIWFETSRNF